MEHIKKMNSTFCHPGTMPAPGGGARGAAETTIVTESAKMKITELTKSGHWPTLLAAFLYFDFSFMVWTLLGPLGAQIGEALGLSPEQKGLMVAVPILSGAVLRIVLGLAVDRFGAKQTGITAQLIVIVGLLCA